MFFYNPDAGPRFYEMAYALGLDSVEDGRSVAPVDFDGDGDLDLVVSSLQSLRLMLNPSHERSFLRVSLEATKTNHHALGAEVVVVTGDRRQWDYVKATAGFMVQVPFELHFGVGTSTVVDRVEIRWPSGAQQTLTDVPVDRRLHVVEGRTNTVRPVPRYRKSPAPPPATSLAVNAPTLEGVRTPLGKTGEVTVVNFWAPWCAPCVTELPALQKTAKALSKVRFVGVSVETKDTASVARTIKRFGLSYDQRYADRDLMRAFFGSDGKADLPSTFVFDDGGNLRRVFSRPVTKVELTSLLTGLSQTPNTSLLVELAFISIRRGDLKTALSHLDEALSHRADDASVHNTRGEVAREMGQLKDSLRSFHRAAELDPKLELAWQNLGVTYFALNQKAEAKAAFLELRALNPGNPHAARFLQMLDGP